AATLKVQGVKRSLEKRSRRLTRFAAKSLCSEELGDQETIAPSSFSPLNLTPARREPANGWPSRTVKYQTEYGLFSADHTLSSRKSYGVLDRSARAWLFGIPKVSV